MSKRLILNLLLTIVVAALLPSVPAFSAPLPGAPLVGNFGTIDLSDGATVLPGPVTPGDLVLQETPTGGTGRTNWSDVVRFFNFSDIFGGISRTFGIAYHMSDTENGMPSIQLVNGLSAAGILPDALDPNSTFAQEIQVGTGTEADITPYSPAAGTMYNVHSDAASTIDHPDVVVQPGTLIVPPPGMQNKPFLFFALNELGEGTVFFSPFDLAPGPIQGALDFGDVLTFGPGPGGFGTIITIVSDPAEGSPFETEGFTAIGDETTSSGYILSEDIPEPGTLVIVLAGLFGMYAVRRRLCRVERS